MHSANHKTSPTASQPHQQPSSYTAFTVSAGASRGQSHNTSIESVEGVPSRHPPQGGSTFLNNRRVPASWAGAGGSSHPTTPKLGGIDGGVISGLAPISRLTPGPMAGAAGGSPSSVSSAASSAAGFPAAPQQQGGYGRRLPTNSPAETAQLDAHNTSVHSNGSDCPQVSQRRPPVQPQHKAALLRSQPSLRASPPSYHAPSATAAAFIPANSSGPRQPSVQSDVPTGRRMVGGPVAPPSAQSVRVVTVQGRPVPMAAAYGADHDRSGGSGSRPPLSHRSTSSAESGGNVFGSAARLPTFPGSATSSRYNFHSDPYDRLQGRSGSAANSDKDLPPSRGSSDTPGRPKKPPTEPAPLEHRLKQREKQLKLGRVTGGYRNYRLLVPFHNRQQGNPDHPTTPDPTTECSKRQWDNLISCWRRDLHRWDTEDNASRKAMKSLRTEGELGRVKYENEDAYRARTMAELEQLYAEINERHNPPSGPPTPDLAPRTSSGSGLGVAPFVIGGIGQSDADHSAAASRSGGGGAFGVIGGGAYHSKGGTTDCSSCASGYDPNSRYDPNAYRAPGSGAASVGAASVERKTSSRFGSEHTLGSGALAAEPVIENMEDRQRLNKELAIWQAQVTLPKGHHASTDSNDGGASTSNTGPTSPSIHVRVLAKDLWGRVEQLATSARGLLTSPTSGTVVVPLTPPTQHTLQRPPVDDESIDGYTSCLLATLATQFELEYLYVVPIQGAPTCLDSDASRNFFKDTVKRILRESVPPPGTSITGDEFWGIVVNAFPVMVYAGELLYNPSVYSAHPVSSVGARSSHPSPIICRPDEGDEGSDIDIPPYETPRAHSSDDEQSPEILEMVAGRSVGVKQQQYDPHVTANYTPLTMADTVAGRASAHDPRYASSTPEFFDAIGERWHHTPEGDLDTSTAPAGAFVGSGALLDVNETGGSCSPVHDIWTPNS